MQNSQSQATRKHKALDAYRLSGLVMCFLFRRACIKDINTQQSFEQLNPRAVGVVVDPIQSVKGKVVIDCFRLINHQMLMLGQDWEQRLP